MVNLKESILAKVRTLCYRYGMGGEEVGVVVEELGKHIDDQLKTLEESMKEKWFWARDGDKEYWRDQGYAGAVDRIFKLLKEGK